jgi:iron complex outermembrane receptor protein
MYNDRDNLRPEASHVADQMRKATFGFRGDYGWAGDHFQLQGDTYDATVTGNGAPEVRLRGANAVANWSHDLGGESRLNIRAWYDHTMRNDPVTFIDTVDTFDIEGQYDLRPWHGNRISVGLGYRNADDRTQPTASVRFIPQDRRLAWRSAFAQDEIQLTPTLTATLGARGQSGVFAGGEFLPDARLSWKPAADHMTWIAASRVARTPGRIDRDFFFPANAPFLIRGGPDFQSERGTVYEVGYRASPRPQVTWSIALFHQDLDRLRGGSLAPDGAGFLISNEIEGRSNGLEAWLLYQASERWRLMAGWLELNQDLHTRPGSTDFGGPAALGNDPRHTFKARSSYRVSSALDVDASFRYVSALAYLSTVPAYGALDLRLAWHWSKAVELSVEGTDLTRSSHVEFDEHGLPAHIPRAVYGQVRLAF